MGHGRWRSLPHVIEHMAVVSASIAIRLGIVVACLGMLLPCRVSRQLSPFVRRRMCVVVSLGVVFDSVLHSFPLVRDSRITRSRNEDVISAFVVSVKVGCRLYEYTYFTSYIV